MNTRQCAGALALVFGAGQVWAQGGPVVFAMNKGVTASLAVVKDRQDKRDWLAAKPHRAPAGRDCRMNTVANNVEATEAKRLASRGLQGLAYYTK